MVRRTTTGLVSSIRAICSEVKGWSWRAMCSSTWSMRESLLSFLIELPLLRLASGGMNDATL